MTIARPLAPGYTCEIDAVDEERWCRILDEFDDASIYQTWSYGTVTAGQRNMSRLVVRAGGTVVAAAQARIARLPFINAGIAYIRWGPFWRRAAVDADADVFRQAIRALRNEFTCNRGLVLRLFPMICNDDSLGLSEILTAEGFSPANAATQGRTIFMDLTPSIASLRQGMKPHWRRELKIAERNGLRVVEGTDDELFGAFIEIYREMVARKRFVEGNDIGQFRRIQALLPERLKMRVMLCLSDTGVCAGLVCSAIGRTALYLFGATSNGGMKSRGSYLLHWRLLDLLRQRGIAVYDLNGINPTTNPGTHKFKTDLAGEHGRDVAFLGRFDAQAGVLSKACVGFGDTVRAMSRTLGGYAAGVRIDLPRPLALNPNARKQ